MRRLLKLSAWVAPVAMIVATASSAPTQFKPTIPVVVELYTSQGCSSCPPADALLGELAGNPDIIALAFHVNYWDGLGWTDPFAMSEATQRQQRYAQALRLSSVFTPQMIINGHRSVVGSDRRSVIAALNDSRDTIRVEASILNGEIAISLDGRPAGSLLNVSAMGYVAEASTQVIRGENAGRALKEFNIVRFVKPLGTSNAAQSHFRLPLSSLPADISGIAILAQRANEGSIVGAAKLALR